MSNTIRQAPLTLSVRRALNGFAAAALVATPLAQAQDQDDAEQLETITVVGSRIKRTDIESSQPVFVLEREDLQKSGLTSVGDILQDLATSAAALNTVANNGGNGSVLVDLRALGPNRVLVLVNGRRWVTNLFGSVDLTTIPVSIIERVEVLKDGASAIYGSDAISGVINITTRDNYDGAEASAYLGENEEGDGRQELYEFTVGSSTERASVVFNASYSKQEPIFAGDREISAVPLFGFNANNVNVGASSTTPFGRFGITGRPGTVTLIPGRSGAQEGDFKPFDLATDGFNFAPDNYLQTPQERTAFFVQGRYQITDAISFRSTALYNERRSDQLLAAMPLVFGTVGSGLARFSIPASNVYNPFGAEIFRAQFRNTQQLRNFAQDNDTFHFAGGFDGSFDLLDRSWSWDATYTYSDNERRDITRGLFDLNRLRTGLGPSFRDANGVARCGTPTAVIAGCVPINLFQGPDGFTREMIDYASFTAQDTRYLEIHNYSANITGDLFELPAGPLSFAAGYEYRREFGFDQPDALISAGASTGNIRQPTRGGFSLDEFYAEFNVPILKDLAFAEIFEVAVAARYSDYSNFGDTTNPKFGFRWKPFGDLLVRGNWSKGFRAPSISELFAGNADSFPQLLDPCSASAQPSGAVLDRCRNGFGGIAPVPAGYEQNNSQIRITGGGNPNLDPERARTRTLGLVYSPSWVEGLDLYLDWYSIEVQDFIGVRTGQFIINNCYLLAAASSCALITRAPDGNVLDLFAGSQNLPGGTEAEGYDLTLEYRFDTEYGKFRVNWDTAYTSYLGSTLRAPGTNFIGNYAGSLLAYPRIKSNASLSWTQGDFGATFSTRYISGLDENCTVPVLFGRPELCSDPDILDPWFGGTPGNHLDETWYFDLQGTWDAPWNGRVTAGIRNLFDEDPPIAFTAFANSFDWSYDVPGRFVYVSYSQKF
jgi:iron complex outermembrane receptor protein